MTTEIPQFGEKPKDEIIERPGAYAVVFNDEGLILTLFVDGEFHLPGGGIDPGEDAKQAVIRECMEEAGCEISDVEFIGKANQYFPENNMNKVADFYKAKMVSIDTTVAIEDDHEVIWMTPIRFIDGPSWGYQRWAVQQTLQ